MIVILYWLAEFEIIFKRVFKHRKNKIPQFWPIRGVFCNIWKVLLSRFVAKCKCGDGCVVNYAPHRFLHKLDGSAQAHFRFRRMWMKDHWPQSATEKDGGTDYCDGLMKASLQHADFLSSITWPRRNLRNALRTAKFTIEVCAIVVVTASASGTPIKMYFLGRMHSVYCTGTTF